MTLDQARALVGHKVVRRVRGGVEGVEEGVITSVSSRWVFIRYGGDMGSKATSPEELEEVSPR